MEFLASNWTIIKLLPFKRQNYNRVVYHLVLEVECKREFTSLNFASILKRKYSFSSIQN